MRDDVKHKSNVPNVLGPAFFVALAIGLAQPVSASWLHSGGTTSGRGFVQGQGDISDSVDKRPGTAAVVQAPASDFQVSGFADIDGDGTDEILRVYQSRVGAFDLGTGALRWSTPALGITSIVDVADMDGDGLPDEIVAVGANLGGGIYIIDLQTGALEASFTDLEGNSGVRLSELALVDVDADGGMELVFAASLLLVSDFYLVDFSTADGKPRSVRSELQGYYNLYNRLAVGDFDGDGLEDEIVTLQAAALDLKTVCEPAMPSAVCDDVDGTLCLCDQALIEDAFAAQAFPQRIESLDTSGDGKAELVLSYWHGSHGNAFGAVDLSSYFDGSTEPQVAGWLFVGKELWRLLRFWGEGRAPFLITVACACLLAVCGLALLGRSLLCVALVENLSETLSWLIAGINELVFSLLLSAALSVNLLWVVVGRRLVAVPSWYRLALGALAVLSPPLCLLLLALGQLSVYEVLNLLAYSVVGAGFVFHARRLKATLEASDDLNDLSFVPPAVKTAWRLAALCVGCVLLELFNFALSAWRGRTARDASDALVWVEAMVPLDLLWTWTIWKYLESQRWLDEQEWASANLKGLEGRVLIDGEEYDPICTCTVPPPEHSLDCYPRAVKITRKPDLPGNLAPGRMVIDGLNLRKLVGDPADLRMVDTRKHYFSDIDGRSSEEALRVWGGEAGELLLALAVWDEMTVDETGSPLHADLPPCDEERGVWKNNKDMMFKLFGRQRLDAHAGAVSRRGRRWPVLVVNPLSRGRMCWDLGISLCILWSAWEIPFTTAFVRVRPFATEVCTRHQRLNGFLYHSSFLSIASTA